MAEPLDSALRYAALGLSVLPVKLGTKKPDLRRWKQYQKRRATENEVRGWFSEGKRNLAVVCGETSGRLVVLDFEDEGAYRYCFPEPLAGRAFPVVATGGGGVHVYIRSKGTVPELPKTLKPVLPLDLQGEGRYVVAPPSVHPSGGIYRWVAELEGEIPEARLDPLLAFLRERAEEWPLVEPVLDAWREGVRHEFALGYAGFLRKRGAFEEGRVRDVVARLCAVSGDPEVEDRLRAVEDTYRREADQVAVLEPLGDVVYAELVKRLPQRERSVEAPRGSTGLSGLDAFNRLKERFRDYFGITDPYVLEVEMATLVTVLMPGDPLWVFVVGPPSGIKTETLRWHRFIPRRVYSTSSLTPHSLIQGLRDGHDLLPSLDGKTLIIKDFTSILEMRRESRDEIFGQLRDAFDGFTEKDFATVGHKSFDARFHVLAGVTGAIEGYYSVQSWLGQRFLKVRVPNVDAFRKALDGSGRETGIRREMAALVADTFSGVDLRAWRNVDTRRVEKLKPVTELVAKARTHVPRDYRGEISSLPDPEMTPRLAKQANKLCIGRAMLHGRIRVVEEDLWLAQRVLLDTIPSLRWKTLDRFREGPWPTKDLAGVLNLPNSTTRRQLEDLVILGILRETVGESNGKGRPPKLYRLREEWADTAGGDATENKSPFFQKSSGRRHSPLELLEAVRILLKENGEGLSLDGIVGFLHEDPEWLRKWMEKWEADGLFRQVDGQWRHP